MSSFLRNFKTNHPVVRALLTKENHLVLITDQAGNAHIKKIDLNTRGEIKSFKIEQGFSTNSHIATTTDLLYLYNGDSKSVETYHIETASKGVEFDLMLYHIDITSFAVSRDGDLFAAADIQGVCSIWSASEDEPIFVIKDLGSIATAMTFCKNKEYLAIATKDKKIRVVNLKTKKSTILEGHRNEINSLIFINDLLISADTRGKLNIWNQKTDKRVKEIDLLGTTLAGISGFDGGRGILLATKSGKILLVDVYSLHSEPLLYDVFGDKLVLMNYCDTTKEMLVCTESGNVLFFNLTKDKEIENYFAEDTSKESISDSKAIKVIVVDDSVTMRKVVVTAIRDSFGGCITLEAGNGKEALDLLEQNPETFAMFLDWNMPTMSGEDVVRAIRAKHSYPDLKIIMATTEGGQEKVTKMLRLGVAGYLVKPFRRESIAKVLSKLLEKAKINTDV